MTCPATIRIRCAAASGGRQPPLFKPDANPRTLTTSSRNANNGSQSLPITLSFSLAILTVLLALPCRIHAHPGQDLIAAARIGDLPRIKKLLADGVDVNWQDRFGITALWQSSWKGNFKVTQTLLNSGADVNIEDQVWKATPLEMTDDLDTVRILVKAGSRSRNKLLRRAALRGQTSLLIALLAGKSPPRHELVSAAAHARIRGHANIITVLEKTTGSTLPLPPALTRQEMSRLTGHYQSADSAEVDIVIQSNQVRLIRNSRSTPLIPASASKFNYDENTYHFLLTGQRVTGFTESNGSDKRVFQRAVPTQPARPAERFADDLTRDNAVASKKHWPQFRGPGARGIGVGQQLPVTWNVSQKTGIRWQIPLQGLANSSPIVWNNHVFVTTATSKYGNRDLRIGLYGAGDAAKDQSEHEWQLLCLALDSGEVLWRHTADRGVPRVKRHQKSTQANSTPATDGNHVVAVFNSGGLYCYDMTGTLCWSQDLGVLDNGAFNDPDYQWGFASSPILVRNLVIVQIDRQTNSCLTAFDVADGTPVWTTVREEPSSWGTPTTYQSSRGLEVVTNGSHFARGNNVKTGKEVWRLPGHSAITVPTPFSAHGLLYVTSGYRPIQPIYAIRLDAEGDISLQRGNQPNKFIAWSKTRGGPYLPTPLVYGNFLYSCSNQGVLTCYHAPTGQQVYRKRISSGGANSFTASLVAADGRLYCTAENGEVCTIKAGPRFEVLARNQLDDYCLSTPAIASQTMLFRTRQYLIAVGNHR